MSVGYPHGESLMPEHFDEHTIIFLMRWLEKSVAVPGYISQAASH